MQDGECVIVTVERIPLEELEDDLPDVKGCNVWKRCPRNRMRSM